MKWNFEKFVITPDGEVHRFRPTAEPDAPEIVGLIEASLPLLALVWRFPTARRA